MAEKPEKTEMTEMEQVMKLFDERILAQMMDNPEHRDAFMRQMLFQLIAV